MATTAKTIQLLDTYHNYISPATNIESLYYEKTENNVTYRCSVWQNFPVYVNYGDNSKDISITVNSIRTMPGIANLKNAGSEYVRLLYYEDNVAKDILISTINDRVINGTNYHAIDVCTYNLSDILSGYCTVPWVETKVSAMNTTIQNLIKTLNSNISTYTDQVANTYTNLSDQVGVIKKQYNEFENLFHIKETLYDYETLKNLQNANGLYAGMVYTVIYDPGTDVDGDYYVATTGFHISLIANSSCSFSNIPVAIIDIDKNQKNWEAQIDFNHSYQIMSDNNLIESSHSLFSEEGQILVNNIIYYIWKNPYYTIWYNSATNWYFAKDSDNFKDASKQTQLLTISNQKTYLHFTYLKDEWNNEAPYDFYQRSPLLFQYNGVNTQVKGYSRCNIIKSYGAITINSSDATHCLLNSIIGTNNYNVSINTDVNNPLNIGINNASIYINSNSGGNINIGDYNQNICILSTAHCNIGNENSSISIYRSAIVDVGTFNADVSITRGQHIHIGSQNALITIKSGAVNINVGNINEYINIGGNNNIIRNNIIGSSTLVINISTNNNILDDYTTFADWNVYANNSSIWFTYKNIIANNFEVR